MRVWTDIDKSKTMIEYLDGLLQAIKDIDIEYVDLLLNTCDFGMVTLYPKSRGLLPSFIPGKTYLFILPRSKEDFVHVSLKWHNVMQHIFPERESYTPEHVAKKIAEIYNRSADEQLKKHTGIDLNDIKAKAGFKTNGNEKTLEQLINEVNSLPESERTQLYEYQRSMQTGKDNLLSFNKIYADLALLENWLVNEWYEKAYRITLTQKGKLKAVKLKNPKDYEHPTFTCV